LGLGTKEAAIDAIKASRFLPGEKDGVQVESKLLFKIPFMLNNRVLFATPSMKVQPKKTLDTLGEKIETVATSENKTNVTTNPTVVVPQNFECEVDVCAKPKDGIKGILDNFVIPSIVKRKGIEGEVIVEAVVDVYGNVRDTKVIKEIGYGCDIAVEVAILQTAFEPGLSNGVPVRSSVKIRVPVVQKKE